ncbi:hypothetical protein BH11BAC4_BH11BAC4_21280 [soil metagenome]
MENPSLFCQSCTMPIDNPADSGTEKDGSKSTEYCKYCYQNAAFTQPDITYEEMKSSISKQMQKMCLPDHVIQQSLKSLPHLKRWEKSAA